MLYSIKENTHTKLQLATNSIGVILYLESEWYLLPRISLLWERLGQIPLYALIRK
nr:MAG TPA: hypothetical protein [Bacteriophage sp.]